MKKVRIGVIGTGSKGRSHAKNIVALGNAKLAAVADIDRETARRVGEEYRVPWFTDHRSLIDSKLCEAVFIATPHYDHPVIGIDAFKAGLHVMTEKPIAVAVSEADRFLEAARGSGRVFAINYQMRFVPEVQMALKIVRSGVLGTIRRTMLVDTWYRRQAPDTGWKGTWGGEGGGVLINQSPHNIDIFTMLGGLPCRVTAMTRAFRHDSEVEDEAHALLEYENGARGYFFATSSELPNNRPSLEIVGDRGKLVWRDHELFQYEFIPPIDEHLCAPPGAGLPSRPLMKGKKLRVPQGRPGTADEKNLGNFCNAIQRGTALVAPGEEGIRSLELVNALILSGQRGRPVELPVDRAEYDRLLEELKRTSRYRADGARCA